MSMMRYVMVIRGVVVWPPRLQIRLVSPEALVPTAQIARALGTQVRQLQMEVQVASGRCRRLLSTIRRKRWHVEWRIARARGSAERAA